MLATLPGEPRDRSPTRGCRAQPGALALLRFEIAPSSALRYLVPNLLGSIVLVVTAWLDAQWAFYCWRERGWSC